MLDQLRERSYEILALSHAEAILTRDFSDALAELERCLRPLTIPVTEIIASGGGQALGTQRLGRSLKERGWKKHSFEIKKTIDGRTRESTSHVVDHVRRFADGRMLALEIEWNNKDPFFDRDLENFKRLHAEGVISVGIIITRGTSMQNNMRTHIMAFAEAANVESYENLKRFGVTPTDKQRTSVSRAMNNPENPQSFREAWVNNFVSNKFGASQTHWGKLSERVQRGVGHPCPLLLIGIPDTIVTPYVPPAIEPDADDAIEGGA